MLKPNEIEPVQVIVEALCGDAAMPAKEGFEPFAPAVDGLDVQLAPDTHASRLVQCPVREAKGDGAGRMDIIAVGDEQGVFAEDGLQ